MTTPTTKITKKKLQEMVTQQITGALTEEGPEPLEAEMQGGDPHEQAMGDFADWLMTQMNNAAEEVGRDGPKRDLSVGKYAAYRKAAEMFHKLFN